MKRKTTSQQKNSLDGYGLTKNPLDLPDGLGMTPRPKFDHQKAIADLLLDINNLMRRKRLKYQAIPEPELGKPNSETPDLTIYRMTDRKPMLIFEIFHNKGQKAVFDKVPMLMSKYPTIQEAFGYNYQSNIFFRFDRSGNRQRGSATKGFPIPMDFAKMVQKRWW